MANSFNLSGISKYTDQIGSELMVNTIMKTKTWELVSQETGVKYKRALKAINGTITVQAGGCELTPTGATALVNRDIQVCPLQVEDKICLTDTEQYWAGEFMKAAGSNNVELPSTLAEKYLEFQSNQIAKVVDTIFWQGDTTGSGNIALCDGLIKLLNADAAVIDTGAGTGTKVALTSANAIAQVNAMVDAMSEDIADADDLTLFLSYQNFMTLVNAYFTANNFHFDVTSAKENLEFMLPTANVKVVAIAGLKGNYQMVLTPASNIAYGADLESDMDNFKLFYDENNDVVRFRAKWKQGAQVYFPGNVVLYSGVPA